MDFELATLNHLEKLNKISSCLKIWNLKGLSTLGRVIIVKSTTISRLIYQLSMLPTPDTNFMSTVKRKLYNFIGNNKHDKMKRMIMNQEHNICGGKMIDINLQNQCLKLAWIVCILQNNECLWVE